MQTYGNSFFQLKHVLWHELIINYTKMQEKTSLQLIIFIAHQCLKYLTRYTLYTDWCTFGFTDCITYQCGKSYKKLYRCLFEKTGTYKLNI